jgi:hypothetical protein
MKKILLVVLFINLTLIVKAQEDEEEKTGGFKKEKMFTGGNVILSFYTGGTVLGISPHLGYSLTNWLDAAVSFNFVYTGETDPYQNKYREYNYGPGAFVRVFPIPFLFAQTQYEHNFQAINITSGSSSAHYKQDVNSLLVGAGIASGRMKGNNTYYYFSLMYDVLKLPNSPYMDSYGRSIPVIRGGFNIALFQGRKENY